MRHFIFDLDGTLVDTQQAVLTTWQRVLAGFGHALMPQDQLHVHGVPMRTALLALGIPWDDRFPAAWMAEYRLHAAQATLYQGIEAMLDQLALMGCTMDAVSSRSRREYEEFFAGFRLNRWIETTVLWEDTTVHKPAPDPLLRYLALTGAAPGDCIYIGDTLADIACANTAGVASGLALWNGSGLQCEEATVLLYMPSDVVSLAELQEPMLH